jgi:polar amino acid transport system substrate-binding protein
MNNFKRAAFVALLSSIAIASAGSARSETITQGVLQVGTDLTYPPYNYFDEKKKPAGFDVEFMTALGKAANLDVRFVDTRFENLIIGVSGNKFDVIASTLYVKPERAKQIDFIPYMKTGVSIAVNAHSTDRPITPEDLCGKRVSVIKAAAWIAGLAQVSRDVCAKRGVAGIDVREFPTSPEATQALISGNVDAQTEDSAVLKTAVTQTGGRVVISSVGNLYPVVVGLGLNKRSTTLEQMLTDALAKIKADGQYDALLRKYNVSAPTEADFKAAVAASN